MRLRARVGSLCNLGKHGEESESVSEEERRAFVTRRARVSIPRARDADVRVKTLRVLRGSRCATARRGVR